MTVLLFGIGTFLATTIESASRGDVHAAVSARIPAHLHDLEHRPYQTMAWPAEKGKGELVAGEDTLPIGLLERGLK
jgi:hypothetical protein